MIVTRFRIISLCDYKPVWLHGARHVSAQEAIRGDAL